MDLELKIKNFGPIDEATIQVGQFTVFAGPNNTGKTFVAKMLYSIFSARDENYAQVFLSEMASSIESGLQLLRQSGQVGEERPLPAIRRGLQKIDSILQNAFSSYPSQNEIDRLKAIHPELMDEIKKIKAHSQTLKNSIKTKSEGTPVSPSEIHNSFEISIILLESGFRNVASVIELGRYFKFRQNVRGNFQTSDLLNLKGVGDSLLHFSVEGVGELRKIEKSLGFTSHPQIVQNMQSPPETFFYLESPLYWNADSTCKCNVTMFRLPSCFVA